MNVLDRSRSCSEVLVPLAGASFSDHPYPLLRTANALDPRLAARVLQWLEAGIEWDVRKGEFYEQWECDLLKRTPPASVARLFRQDVRDDLGRRVGEIFGTAISSRMTVVAHKLLRGQEIGVHNDDPDPGLETHRLVVQLNRVQGTGGRFRIHGSRNSTDVVDVIEPRHNSAVAFAMSARSWHSVEAMGDWARYTLIFSFWSEQAATHADQTPPPARPGRFSAAAVAASLDPRELERLERLTDLLARIGAADAAHSRASLLEHLVATYLVLRSWGGDVELATAGLFHSIYGTGAFHLPLLALEDRHVVAELIGERAERVAFLFCVGTKESLFANIGQQLRLRVISNRTGESLPISSHELRDLLTLDLANTLEQNGRVEGAADGTPGHGDTYERASDLLPKEALAWLRAVRSTDA